ncbi:MAG: UvrD-helicase domain-containing protein, partial [Chloroflexi bacterium]|nr:UvrD-helicase domain-containing protein [Chloroflexota bacterium]
MIHPIVAQMKPSEEQLLAIMDSGQDVIVTAGAGAGKTRTLVARYLRLLTESARLRSIVAITFTEKAAREMRNRVRQQIDLYLQNPAIDSHEKDRFQALYSELDSARISTIHSLCTEIVRGHPAELGIDPLFGVLDEGRTGILRGLALEDALNWAANDPQAVALFALLDERPLRKTVETLLTRRLEADEVFRKMPDDLLRHWQDILEQRQREALTTLRSREEWSEALKDLQANQANDPGDLLEIGRQVALAAASAPLEPLGECLARMKELGTIRWDRGKAKAWPNGKEQVQNALHVMKELWKANADLLNLALNPQDERLAEAIPLLKTVYEYATARYQALKDERNVLDFDDLESRALELLTEHPDVRERWQRQVRAILVDEYQDTNARQNQLVELLNGGEGKLFVVGDAKQSIYAFRGADVAVFRQLRERARQHNGITRELRETYRAHPDLVEALNTLLKPVLGECQDPARPWIEPFAPLIAPYEPLPRPIPTAADGGEKMSCVEVHLGLGTKGNHALDLAADALAARLREMVEGKQQMVRVGGGTRYAEYGDIAVLCRASTAFSAYEDAFDRAGLPFLTVAGRGFYDRPEIRDLLNILT